MTRFRQYDAARRAGFTLLEILLALTIGVALLSALYVAMRTQLAQTQQARDVVQQAEVARSIFTRISRETAACVPANRSMTNFQGKWPSGRGGGGRGGASGGSGGSSASAGGSSSTSSAGSSASSGSSSGSSSSSSTNSNSSPYAIPFMTGLQGDRQTLTLYVSVNPREVWDRMDAGKSTPMCDQRRITYWLANGGGLARQEVDQVTSDDQMSNLPPNVSNEASDVIASEVQSVQFRYYDGNSWQHTWDGSQTGTDGTTPLGPPVAVEITLGIVRKGQPVDAAHTKTYRRVVAIVSGANPNIQTPPTASTSSGSSSSSSSSTSP